MEEHPCDALCNILRRPAPNDAMHVEGLTSQRTKRGRGGVSSMKRVGGARKGALLTRRRQRSEFPNLCDRRKISNVPRHESSKIGSGQKNKDVN